MTAPVCLIKHEDIDFLCNHQFFRDNSALVHIKETFDQVTGFKTNDAKIFRLYNAAFKRLSDANGLKYWIEKYTSGENDVRAVA